MASRSFGEAPKFSAHSSRMSTPEEGGIERGYVRTLKRFVEDLDILVHVICTIPVHLASAFQDAIGLGLWMVSALVSGYQTSGTGRVPTLSAHSLLFLTSMGALL